MHTHDDDDDDDVCAPKWLEERERIKEEGKKEAHVAPHCVPPL